MLLGLYILVPLAMGVLCSTIGLGLEMIATHDEKEVSQTMIRRMRRRLTRHRKHG